MAVYCTLASRSLSSLSNGCTLLKLHQPAEQTRTRGNGVVGPYKADGVKPPVGSTFGRVFITAGGCSVNVAGGFARAVFERTASGGRKHGATGGFGNDCGPAAALTGTGGAGFTNGHAVALQAFGDAFGVKLPIGAA